MFSNFLSDHIIILKVNAKLEYIYVNNQTGNFSSIQQRLLLNHRCSANLISVFLVHVMKVKPPGITLHYLILLFYRKNL